MCKRLICLTSLIVVLALTGSASADVLVHWTFDEGSGTTVSDMSGNDRDGTFVGNPQWVTGQHGGALEFNGSSDYVIHNLPAAQNFANFTVALWVKASTLGQSEWMAPFSSHTPNSSGIQIDVDGTNPGNYRTNPPGGTGAPQFGPVTLEWIHLALVGRDTAVEYYYNGTLAATSTFTANQLLFNEFLVGNSRNNSNYFGGAVDDFRVLDEALSADDIQRMMLSQGIAGMPLARKPSPEDGAFSEQTWAGLAWTPGDWAVSHDLYFGTAFDDVNDGAEGTFVGNLATTQQVVGFPGFPAPEGLLPGTTYHWRVDEVNDANVASPWKGDVWSFSVPPRTAYAPVPPDGAESVALDAGLSWAAGFEAKLHTVYFGDNFDDVSNAAGGTLLGDPVFTPPGPLELAKTYYWRVDEFDPPTTHKGEVWSFTAEGTAADPYPAKGAVDTSPTPILKWTAASLAASHEVYFGTDPDAVANAGTASPEHKTSAALGEESYDAGRLDLETTYYWRVDEVNSTEPGSPWIGNVWSFTTGDFLVVDDFESYNDIDPPDAASNRIFDKWIDGFGTTTNGALVGNDLPPYAEQTVVHGGAQSMPYFYDNANKTSEATLTLVYPRDWTEEGVAKLSLWHRGASANAPDRISVALNGTAVVYHDDPAATQLSGWNEWVIDLTAFTGVDLTNVNTITVGFGTKNSPAAGGTGTMYFDDMRLER